MKTMIAAFFFVVLSVFSAETPDQLRDKGFEALKAAQSDETKIVEAARLLAQAAEAYEKAGDESAATELGSYLYWCKKRMTLEQAETFSNTGDAGKRIAEKLNAVAQKVEASDVGKWLEKADTFSSAHPNEPLLCAIRYFEVADRFVGAQESLIAQRKSLELMGKVAPVASQVPQSSFRFGSWEVSLPRNQVSIVNASVGQQWWYSSNGGSGMFVQQMPAYLSTCKMIQQKAGCAWIDEIKSNRPFVVYAVVRLQIKRTAGVEVFMSEKEFLDMSLKSGWKQTGGCFRGDWVNEVWTWKVVGKQFASESSEIDNPFAGTKNPCAIFFLCEK